MCQVFGINTVRTWQVEALNHALFKHDPLIFINQRDADGKCLIPLITGVIMQHIVIVLVTLLGLGSDQVGKVSVPANNIEACHMD